MDGVPIDGSQEGGTPVFMLRFSESLAGSSSRYATTRIAHAGDLGKLLWWCKGLRRRVWKDNSVAGDKPVRRMPATSPMDLLPWRLPSNCGSHPACSSTIIQF